MNPEVTLASLTVSPGTLQPGFSGGTTQYSVELTSNTTTVTITAQAAVSGDTVSIDGEPRNSHTVALGDPGSTTPVSIVVSESGTNSRTYTVLLKRAALAGNNSLQGLTVSPGTPPIVFNENTLTYTVDVASTVESVAVTPTLQDSAATMTVKKGNGQAEAATSGQPKTITLNPAGQSTLITIEVTALNQTKKSYTILVNRGGLSSINNLQSLTVTLNASSPNLITNFDPNTQTYPVNVASTVTSVRVRPTLPENSNASMSLRVNSGQPSNINSGDTQIITLGQPDTNTFINIIVTAQNGTPKTYIVAVDRAPSNDNNLSALSVRVGTVAQTLSPSPFNRNTTTYTVDVASNVTSVTVSATKADQNAAIAIASATIPNGSVTVPAGTATGEAPVTLGGLGSETPVSVTVTPQIGNPKTYSLTITRLSSNNNLSALSVTAGTEAQALSPTFAPSTSAYTVNVATEVTEVTVSATKDDPDAVMGIGSVTAAAGTASGQAIITLNGAGEDTTASITVTAQNGTVRNPPYTITVKRPAPAAPPTPEAPATAPDLTTESDSGVQGIPESFTDNRTNVLTPSFTVAPPAAGETASLYVGIGTNPREKVATSFDQATNTLTMTNPLPSEGEYDITVTSTVTNSAGVESLQSPALTVTIDNGAPGAPTPPGS
ncbi:MAG: cadherin-like beta sandwich domain-containing protein [Nitrospira sp.]|nr:cadherin-like beta sandwich domain-containing protein [Nitrospira sp.]MDH4242280.1 cadherin-like beta sandwich domain-containing protein [Nitrospira sp.]MDH4354599.1 cadherin-like beta sandwich domain-containing protein [Nitrospira sp.]MDH5319528.1 cadherin-like beta sandwich domain-containing protein [Nitrospira sp.]